MVMILMTPALHAQSATPGMIADIKKQYNEIKSNLIRAAEKMTDDGYSFQPVKEVRTFGGWVGHVADAQTRGCSRMAGAQRSARKVPRSCAMASPPATSMERTCVPTTAISTGVEWLKSDRHGAVRTTRSRTKTVLSQSIRRG